jgi:hypothetical protein
VPATAAPARSFPLADVLADDLGLARNGLTSASAAAAAICEGEEEGGSGEYGDAGLASYRAMSACLSANEALLHRAVLRRPLGVLKYAMTLDGKIATNLGHSAWVSSPESRWVDSVRACVCVDVCGCAFRGTEVRGKGRKERTGA